MTTGLTSRYSVDTCKSQYTMRARPLRTLSSSLSGRWPKSRHIGPKRLAQARASHCLKCELNSLAEDPPMIALSTVSVAAASSTLFTR